MSNRNNSHIDSDGSIHILITKGWEPPPPQPVIVSYSSPHTNKPIIIDGNNGNPPQYPGIPQQNQMIFKLPEMKPGANLMPITVILEVHKKVVIELNAALSQYPKNIDEIKKDATTLLSHYHHADIPDSISFLVEKVTNSLYELNTKTNEINTIKESIKKQEIHTDEQFNSLMNHDYVALGNAKKMVSEDPNKLDILYSFIMNISHIKKDFYINNWRTMVENPNNVLITLKNDLIVLLTTASAIISDVNNDINQLKEDRNENDDATVSAAKFAIDVSEKISELYGK